MGPVVLEVKGGCGLLPGPDPVAEQVYGELMGGLKGRIGLVVLCAFKIRAGPRPSSIDSLNPWQEASRAGILGMIEAAKREKA